MKGIIAIIFSILIFSCTTQQKQKTGKINFNEISFGSGGGFTGISNEYRLQADGKVFRMDNGTEKQLNKINRTEIKRISKLIEETGFQKIQLNERGNMTYFIQLKANENIQKITWTDSSQASEVKELYKTLVNTLKKKQ